MITVVVFILLCRRDVVIVVLHVVVVAVVAFASVVNIRNRGSSDGIASLQTES